MRRTRFDIIVDILTCLLNGGKNKTKIVYGANLNFRLVEKYLEILIEKGLVEEENVDGKTLYHVTEKGLELVKIYRKLAEEEYLDVNSSVLNNKIL